MKASPIPAATSSQSTGSACPSAPADNFGFQQVLQQMNSSAAYEPTVTQAIGPTVSSAASNKVIAEVSSKINPEVTSAVISGVTSSVTSRVTPASGSLSDGSPQSVNPAGAPASKQDAKQAKVAGEPKTKESKESSPKESRVSSTADAGAPVPVIAVATPAAPDVFSNQSLPTDSLSTLGQSVSTQTAELRWPSASDSNPATASLPGLIDSPIAASAASEKTANETPAAQPLAKPQAAPSSSALAVSAASSATSVTNDTAAHSPASQHILNTLAQDALAKRNFAISHPALHPGTLSEQITNSHAQRASRTSAAADKFNGSAETSERDSNPNASSSPGTHLSSVQAVPASASLPATQSAAQFTTQLAPQSAVFAQPAQPGGPHPPSFGECGDPAPAHPQLQSNPIPDPPRMVDSGQLRVTPNHSELKVSVQLPELGKVEVRAVTAHDVTTAHLTAFQHDALHALASGRDGLEQALKSRDVILGSFDSHPQGHSGGQQREQKSYQTFAATSAGTATVPPTISVTAEAPTGLLPHYSSISIRA